MDIVDIHIKDRKESYYFNPLFCRLSSMPTQKKNLGIVVQDVVGSGGTLTSLRYCTCGNPKWENLTPSYQTII